MTITQLDIENADRNLTSEVLVLTHTPSTTGATKVQASVELGDGIKDLDSSGGSFTLRVEVGGVSMFGGGVTKTVSAIARTILQSDPFVVPANTEVKVYVTSPNGADTDVDVNARLFDVAVDEANLNDVTLADDAITADKFDEATAYPLRANTLNDALEGTITGQVTATTLATTQFTTDLSGYDNDRLIGRLLTFTNGPLAGESVDITGYAATGGVVTVTTLTEAPTAGDEFVIT